MHRNVAFSCDKLSTYRIAVNIHQPIFPCISQLLLKCHRFYASLVYSTGVTGIDFEQVKRFINGFAGFVLGSKLHRNRKSTGRVYGRKQHVWCAGVHLKMLIITTRVYFNIFISNDMISFSSALGYLSEASQQEYQVFWGQYTKAHPLWKRNSKRARARTRPISIIICGGRSPVHTTTIGTENTAQLFYLSPSPFHLMKWREALRKLVSHSLPKNYELAILR